jgi:hypothetical protein
VLHSDKDKMSSAASLRASKNRELPTNSNNKIDPRVRNIDKINMKIKKILDCLHENDNHRNNQLARKNFFLGGPTGGKGPHANEGLKLLEKHKLAYEKEAGTPHQPLPITALKSNERCSPSPQIKHNSISRTFHPSPFLAHPKDPRNLNTECPD